MIMSSDNAAALRDLQLSTRFVLALATWPLAPGMVEDMEETQAHGQGLTSRIPCIIWNQLRDDEFWNSEIEKMKVALPVFTARSDFWTEVELGIATTISVGDAGIEQVEIVRDLVPGFAELMTVMPARSKELARMLECYRDAVQTLARRIQATPAKVGAEVINASQRLLTEVAPLFPVGGEPLLELVQEGASVLAKLNSHEMALGAAKQISHVMAVPGPVAANYDAGAYLAALCVLEKELPCARMLRDDKTASEGIASIMNDMVSAICKCGFTAGGDARALQRILCSLAPAVGHEGAWNKLASYIDVALGVAQLTSEKLVGDGPHDKDALSQLRQHIAMPSAL